MKHAAGLAALLLAPLLLASAFALADQDPLQEPNRDQAEGGSQEPELPARPVTVIALRHGEKAADDPRDPHLSEQGHTRAQDLAQLLSHAGVTHLFSTPYHRTRDTLAPLVQATGLALTEYSPRNLSAFAEQLAALPPGSVAVVSGHSNTTPSLVLALGGDIIDLETVRGTPSLNESEYDRLFLTTLPVPGERIRAKTLELRYGD